MTSGARPLDGLVVTVDPDTGPPTDRASIETSTAVDLLTRLGATVVHRAGSSPGDPATSGLPTDVDGIPDGTLAVAAGIALAGAAVLAALAGRQIRVDRDAIALQVLLPVAMAASYGTTHREPPSPVAVGDGWVACDFASDDDSDTFERLLDSLGPLATDPRVVADEAQAWRLPVCAFVDPARGDAVTETERSVAVEPTVTPHEVVIELAPAAAAPVETPARDGDRPPLEGLVVCDLTAMWAGPLTTWLLASLGAVVHKIEPTARLDGLRARNGTGIHPPGVATERGDASAMFNALNRGKQTVDLDLRDDEARVRFEQLVATSDVVIDNFSRRVMSNLGYPPDRLRALRPDVVSVSMPAFPRDHPWQVALGPGIHAASGLGGLPDGQVATATVAYPDPLTGLTAFVETVAALWARRRGDSVDHRDVPMLTAVSPLVRHRARSRGRDDRLARRDRHLGRRLLDDPGCRVLWEPLDDGAGRHLYPKAPFSGGWRPPRLAPAAPIDPTTEHA